ncbi:hypothetical protein [Exiguobacterium sp. 9-2]|nr:hypothetical protein [Exiguobacterium sp. 9-2]
MEYKEDSIHKNTYLVHQHNIQNHLFPISRVYF